MDFVPHHAPVQIAASEHKQANVRERSVLRTISWQDKVMNMI